MEADLMYRTPCNYEVRCGELNRYRGIQVFPCTSPKSMYWTPILLTSGAGTRCILLEADGCGGVDSMDGWRWTGVPRPQR
jgi:hypothetical protein